jgi:hypothetical protein
VAAVGALAVLALLGAWLVYRSAQDSEAAAKKVATAYIYARLTHHYSVWWDTVDPACRPAISKSQWVAQISAGFQSLGTRGGPADTRVQVVSLTHLGDELRVDVRVSSRAPTRTGELEVDVKQVGGSWRVSGYGTPGDADDCAVL